MPRTGATFMQFIRSLQHPPPDPSVQATVHALMGGPEQPVAPIDVDVFAFGSEAPLEVATKRALFSPGLKKACDMHKKRSGPFALGTEPPVLATPAGGTRRSGGASLRRRRRFRVASGRGCCAQLAIAHSGFLGIGFSGQWVFGQWVFWHWVCRSSGFLDATGVPEFGDRTRWAGRPGCPPRPAAILGAA